MKNLTANVLPHGPHWAIEESAAQQLWSMLQNTSLDTHRAERVAELRQEVKAQEGISAAASDEKSFEFRDGIAVLDLVGPMTKVRTSFSSGTSTSRLRDQVRRAGNDPDVKGIMLRVDSPGGSVAGTDDLAREVAMAARKKPFYCYIEDLGASAAYWVSSQGTKLFANPTGLVGSLGTIAVLYDSSKYAESVGVKVLVFSTGKFKGAGTPGAEITDEQRDQFQSLVDDLNDDFVTAVARGRNMTKADARLLFDGSVQKAPKALKAGLIDGICSFDEAFSDLRTECFAKAEDFTDLRATFEAKAAEEDEDEDKKPVPTAPDEDEDTEEDEEDEAKKAKTISGQEGAHAALPLANETETLLADARSITTRATGLQNRIAGLSASRADDGRTLGPKAIGHIDDTAAQLEGTATELTSLAVSLRTLKPEPKGQTSTELQREILRAQVSLAS